MCVFFGGSYGDNTPFILKRIMENYTMFIGIYLVIGMGCYFFLTYDDAKEKVSLIGKVMFLLISPPYLVYLILKSVTSSK